MRKAASLGLALAKPCGEGERFDFIATVENVCWRIQVKSVLAKSRLRHHYRVKIAGRRNGKQYGLYSAKEIDFLVTYIFQEDVWYVLPADTVENRKVLCLFPGSKRSRFEQYREAWKLMKPPSSQVTVESTVKAMPEP